MHDFPAFGCRDVALAVFGLDLLEPVLYIPIGEFAYKFPPFGDIIIADGLGARFFRYYRKGKMHIGGMSWAIFRQLLQVPQASSAPGRSQSK